MKSREKSTVNDDDLRDLIHFLFVCDQAIFLSDQMRIQLAFTMFIYCNTQKAPGAEGANCCLNPVYEALSNTPLAECTELFEQRRKWSTSLGSNSQPPSELFLVGLPHWVLL